MIRVGHQDVRLGVLGLEVHAGDAQQRLARPVQPDRADDRARTGIEPQHPPRIVHGGVGAGALAQRAQAHVIAAVRQAQAYGGAAVQAVSLDPWLRVRVPLMDGRRLTALEIQECYLAECERAVRDNRLSVSDSQALSKAYESGLSGYTYLE